MTDPARPTMAAGLYRAFSDAWADDTRGGWRARWRRRTIWPALGAQKCGLHLRVSARLFWGARMRVLTGETASQSILAFGYSETALTALLFDLISPGQCLVDVGTHFGYEAMLMARLTGANGSVHAFEPNPEVAAYAAHNLAATPWVQLHALALSNACGRTSFAAPPLARSAFGGLGGGDSHRIEVELQTLDNVFAGLATPVALIKCDAEGHEESILQGASRLIARDHPVLVLETGMPDAHGKSSPVAGHLAALLAPSGYRAFSFEFDGTLRVAPLDSFPTGHANTLYLPGSHPRFGDYQANFQFPPAAPIA
jgi:FkbM family methyltransferase